MIEHIFGIKKIKADKARIALIRQEKILKKSKEEVEQAEDRLQEYQKWQLEEQLRQFNEMQGNLVKYSDIEALNRSFSLMNAKENELKDKLETCEKVEEKEQASFDKKEKVSLIANKNEEKFSELSEEDAYFSLQKGYLEEEKEFEDINLTLGFKGD